MTVTIALLRALAHRAAAALIGRLPRIHASADLRLRAHIGHAPAAGRRRRRRSGRRGRPAVK